MVRMKHGLFGTDMWVADERVEEYQAAGHVLAAPDAQKPEEPKKRRKKEQTDGIRNGG